MSILGTINKTRDKKAELQTRLKELQIRKKILEVRDDRFEKRRKEAIIKVDEQKRDLEKIISDLSSKNVKIVADKID